MASRQPLHKAMKRAENAEKRKHFNPLDHQDEKYPWYVLEVGDSFSVSNYFHKTSVVRTMATYRTGISGFEYKVKKLPEHTRVERVA